MFFFDERWYLSRTDIARDVQRSGLRPEEHYHKIGAPFGNSPNRYFDEIWYRRTYADVRRQIKTGEFKSAFHHYIVRGAAEARDPNAAFDEKRICPSTATSLRPSAAELFGAVTSIT